MTTRIVRAPHEIEGDALMEMAVRMTREARERRVKAKAEEDALKVILAQLMKDNDATELTLGGVPVARITTFNRDTVKLTELLAEFPQAAHLVNSTPVVRVELP